MYTLIISVVTILFVILIFSTLANRDVVENKSEKEQHQAEEVVQIQQEVEPVTSFQANSTSERILCAAIWYPEHELTTDSVKNVKGLVLLGHRHHNVISTCYQLLGLKQFQMGKNIQGFLTSHNRFVTREEAATIAATQKQLKQGLSKVGRLYSEDLY